jgi:hypothetical protein
MQCALATHSEKPNPSARKAKRFQMSQSWGSNHWTGIARSVLPKHSARRIQWAATTLPIFIRSGDELDLEKIANVRIFPRQSLDFRKTKHMYRYSTQKSSVSGALN